jgi:hypothetical protein
LEGREEKRVSRNGATAQRRGEEGREEEARIPPGRDEGRTRMDTNIRLVNSMEDDAEVVPPLEERGLKHRATKSDEQIGWVI